MLSFIEFYHFMHFLGFSRWKTPKDLAGHDATYVRCPNSFKFCMEAFDEHAHMLSNFGVIASMARSTPCSMVVVRVAGRASLDALFLHINKMDPNFFPHTSITMQSTHDKFHWVMTFYIFFRIFPVKNPKTLAERDTRCIWCSNSFNFCMKACHACPHADKICVISCMPRSTSCSKVGVRVGR